MNEEIIEVTGKEDGPVSIILAGVHGDEKCGVEAFENILPNLTIASGTVYFGYGNPRAILENTRFTEANLNRLFKDDSSLSERERGSYEYERAQYLKKYLDKAEVLFDIHATSIPESKSFAICEENAKDIVRFFPTGTVVSGFDDVEAGATDYYMNSVGKVGICLECGYTKEPQSTVLAEESIFAFLKARGHIENDLVPQVQSRVDMFQKYYAKTDSFVLAKPFENFEVLDSGELIGMDGGKEVRSPKRCVILFAHNGKKVGDEVFLLGEHSKVF